MRKARPVDLKLRLTLRVAALAASCFILASAYTVYEANRAARARVAEIARMVAGALALQHAQSSWIRQAAVAVPDMAALGGAFDAPGICIAYRAQSGETRQQVCNGPNAADAQAPAAFAFIYTALFDPGGSVSRSVDPAGPALGQVAVAENAGSVIAQAWRETSRLLAIMAVTLLGLCLLVHAALARALRPTRVILVGLERLAANDLSARLPDFDLAELSRIKDVFNYLAASLDAALIERNELTRRLIAVQDRERQALARELHDEFGQCLAAIAAMAASAGQTARDECPALVPECRNIQNTAAQMMQALRDALIRLRSPETDRFGLVLSVESLVAGWNARSEGQTRYAMEVSGRFQSLPAEIASGIYRIAQEALTNAARHANATRVQLRLLRHIPAQAAERTAAATEATEAGGGGGGGHIELVVEDNGKLSELDHLGKMGMGLLGMRERITLMGGQLRLEPGRPTGLTLRALIPLPLAPGAG